MTPSLAAPRCKIILIAGQLLCEIWPEVGGGVARFEHLDGEPFHILRPTPSQSSYQTTDLACWPLVPFSNRIAYGKFQFGTRTIEIPLNVPGQPHALHGQGWQCVWNVEKSDRSSCLLSLSHHADTSWPFSYVATQSAALTTDCLELTLRLENIGTEDMPCGLGFHPYFSRQQGTRLEANARGVWLTDDTALPTERVAVPERWNLEKGITLDNVVLDNCFHGFRGEARISMPGREMPVLLSSPEATHLIVYCPEDEKFVCVEPATHMPDAFNRAAAGIETTGHRVLGAGEALSLTMRISIGNQSQFHPSTSQTERR